MMSYASVLGLWLFQESAVAFDPMSMWNQMGVPAKLVVIALFAMSAWSIGVMIDRWIAFSAARKQSRMFAPAVAGALREGKLDEAVHIAERHKKSHLAKVVIGGLQEFQAHQDSSEIPGEEIEASKRALERAEAIVHAELKRGMGTLATIGSTAPFVGLFGTVVGIINAFHGIASEKQPGLAAVAGGKTGLLFRRNAVERVDDADDRSEQSHEGGRRTDGGERAHSALQFGLDNRVGA